MQLFDILGWIIVVGFMVVFFLGMTGVIGRAKSEMPEDGPVSDEKMLEISPEVQPLMAAAYAIGVKPDFGFMARLQRTAMLWKTTMGKNKHVTMQLEAKMREACRANKFELELTDNSVIIKHKKGSIQII